MSSAEKTVMFAIPNLVSGKIACVAGVAAGRSWDLSAGTFTIGRNEDNDMSLPTEPGVSKLHAKIVGQGDRYLIMDCESRNGTIVNGDPVQKADLYDGDEIQICGCVLRFTHKGGPARPARRQPAPQLQVEPPTEQYQEPLPPPPSLPPQPMPMPVVVQAPPAGRGLLTYYMGGLVSSLLLGGAASAALIASAPPPAPPTPPLAPVPAAVVAPPPAPVDAATPPRDAATPPVDAAVPPPAAPPVDAATPPPAVPADPPPDKPADPPADAAAVDAKAAATEAAADDDNDDKPAVATKERKPRRSGGGGGGSSSGPFAASVDNGRAEVLRSKTGGKVKTALADGAAVQKGTIIVTFESGADPAELATLQDRIGSLEGVESEEAKRDLKAAKAKLAALEAGQNAAPLVAGMDGLLRGFTATPGAVLKAGETVGKIVDGDVVARVKVTVSRSTRPRTGQSVMMNLKSGGSISGTIVSVSGRTVIIDPGGETAENVESVSF